MERDWELLKRLLEEARKTPAGQDLVLMKNGVSYNGLYRKLSVGEDYPKGYEHIQLLADAGLVFAYELGQGQGRSPRIGISIDRLSMAGHDFLEAAHNETAWSKAKNVTQQVGGMTISLMKDLLVSYIKAEVAKHTGLPM